MRIKRAFVIVVLLGCGGGTKPTPVGNQAEPVEPASDPADDADDPSFVHMQTATGGIIELRGDHSDLGMADANTKMSAHCGPGNYQITQEGVEIIGSNTTDGNVEDVRAWRVHYACL